MLLLLLLLSWLLRDYGTATCAKLVTCCLIASEHHPWACTAAAMAGTDSCACRQAHYANDHCAFVVPLPPNAMFWRPHGPSTSVMTGHCVGMACLARAALCVWAQGAGGRGGG